MTVADLEQSVRGSLRQADLLQYLDEEETQFLEFPDGWFAEIVVKDGSKLPEVESVLQKFKADLQREQAVELDEIVRPAWNVATIKRAGPSVSFPGLEPAVEFIVVLESGSLPCKVTVDVTKGALELIREKVRDTKAPEDVALHKIVHEFMKLQLSHGGTSYWDPRKEPRLELNAAAFMYMMGRRDSFERLKSSIDNVFGGRTENQILGIEDTATTMADRRRNQIRAFVGSLNFAGMRIRDFEQALRHLPGPGAAFARGQQFLTLNSELYQTLFDDEKEKLREYYLHEVGYAEEDYPELAKEFPTVFR